MIMTTTPTVNKTSHQRAKPIHTRFIILRPWPLTLVHQDASKASRSSNIVTTASILLDLTLYVTKCVSNCELFLLCNFKLQVCACIVYVIQQYKYNANSTQMQPYKSTKHTENTKLRPTQESKRVLRKFCCCIFRYLSAFLSHLLALCCLSS